jgi:uncharacterized RDD family membrane protein YckC
LSDPAQRHTGTDNIAGLARRLGSIAYEALLLTAVLFLSTWIFLFFGQFLDATIARALLQLWLLAVTGSYLVYCWTHGGQTLPMKTWRVRLAASDGGAVPLHTAVKRFFLVLVSAGACGLGFAWALVDRERQFLHDRLAGTRLFLLPG